MMEMYVCGDVACIWFWATMPLGEFHARIFTWGFLNSGFLFACLPYSYNYWETKQQLLYAQALQSEPLSSVCILPNLWVCEKGQLSLHWFKLPYAFLIIDEFNWTPWDI